MPSPHALDTATAAVESARELTAVEWHAVEAAELPDAAVAVATLKALAEAALVQIAGGLEETGAADALGWANAKDFLTHVTGGRKGTGATYVRVAKQTGDLPDVRDAMASGELSLVQASVIGGRVSTLPHEETLRGGATEKMLDLVRTEALDATDLDRRFPGVVHDLDPDGTLLGSDLDKEREERGAHHARFLSFTPDTLGGVRIKGYATLEDTELVKTALMPLAAPQPTEPGACGGDPHNISNRDPHTGRRIGHGCPDPNCWHDGKDPREAGARLWDALVESCRRLQATDSLPHAHGTTARITVTTSIDDLRAGLAEKSHATGGLLPSGDTLSATAVRRLACDAEIIPAVLATEGHILDLGRTARLVTAGLWLALVLRDQHCIFPGCTRPAIACDAHHIVHWADGGPTSLDNLVLICRHHHTVAHQTPWKVHIDPTTGKPAWTPPPLIDDTDRFTYYPARARPPSQPPSRPPARPPSRAA